MHPEGLETTCTLASTTAIQAAQENLRKSIWKVVGKRAFINWPDGLLFGNLHAKFLGCEGGEGFYFNIFFDKAGKAVVPKESLWGKPPEVRFQVIPTVGRE